MDCSFVPGLVTRAVYRPPCQCAASPSARPRYSVARMARMAMGIIRFAMGEPILSLF